MAENLFEAFAPFSAHAFQPRVNRTPTPGTASQCTGQRCAGAVVRSSNRVNSRRPLFKSGGPNWSGTYAASPVKVCWQMPSAEADESAGMTAVTQILTAIEQGDSHAAEQLLPLVYNELRELAARRLAREKPGQTLQATALVHEAYLRLVKGDVRRQWTSRGHFFAAAAEAMRRILVDQARRRGAVKRGGKAGREELRESTIAAAEPVDDVLALNDALNDFAAVDPLAARLVSLRFFAGMTMGEAALALDMSVRSAQDLWAYSRSWLHRQMRHP
jgi:RNA polymerase sigma factor (TIGR02999 family)